MAPSAFVKKKTLLIVEDDRDIRESMMEVFENEGYRVVGAANGEEGISALERMGTDLPNLIVLDLTMPVKDGFAFRLEQTANPKWKHIPVIVMTADASAIQRMEQTGSKGFLRKPVDLVQMLTVIDKHSN